MLWCHEYANYLYCGNVNYIKHIVYFKYCNCNFLNILDKEGIYCLEVVAHAYNFSTGESEESRSL